MTMLIQVLTSFFVGIIGGVLTATLLFKRVRRRERFRITAWLFELERAARANPTATTVVELPGMQAVMRAFVREFRK